MMRPGSTQPTIHRSGPAHRRRGTEAGTAAERSRRPGPSRTGVGLNARERLEQHGVSTLSDADLLTILAGPHGSLAADAVLTEVGTIQGLPLETLDDLALLDGVTPRTAAIITAAVELGRRTLRCPPPEGAQLGWPARVAEYLTPEHGSHPIERFGMISLNTKHRVLRTTVLSTGTIEQCPVTPGLVFRTAAAHRAAAIILFHNHVSGDPHPSEDDIRITQRLVDAGRLIGIEVIDHFVLAGTRYCSLRELGHF